jgi:hypothetical protein
MPDLVGTDFDYTPTQRQMKRAYFCALKGVALVALIIGVQMWYASYVIGQLVGDGLIIEWKAATSFFLFCEGLVAVPIYMVLRYSTLKL